jgi:hypothetical protein
LRLLGRRPLCSDLRCSARHDGANLPLPLLLLVLLPAAHDDAMGQDIASLR